MTLPKWQEKLVTGSQASIAPPRITFNDAKKVFAVDVSGSTAGAIIRTEGESVETFATTEADNVCKWSTHCTGPVPALGLTGQYWKADASTEPLSIMQQTSVVQKIRNADLWCLYTDGEIWGSGVIDLTAAAESAGVIHVPVIVMIFGYATQPPERENISVGISFFAYASDAVIVYKDVRSKKCYIINAKGAFNELQQKFSSDLSKWDNLTRYQDDKALLKALMKVSFERDRSARNKQGISLGPEWDAATDGALVKVAELLDEAVLSPTDIGRILQDEAFNNLALACKLRGRLGDLHKFLARHKQQEIVIQLEDRHGAAELMQKLQATDDPIAKVELSDQLRQAHASNRATYQRLRDSPSEETKAIVALNRLIDKAFQVVSGLEKSGYTADILNRKSNRAMRAEQVSAADTQVKLAALDLSDDVAAYRGECSICAGEHEIMSVVLKELETVEENTTDFALNFPLAAGHAKQNANIVSSQSICFQCALLLERSIYQEEIAAKLPAVSLTGANKQYVMQQLYLGLTARLATGVSGVIQLFMTILDKTITTKSWCADNPDDAEAQARRKLLAWMLLDLLQSCPCREDFAETGAWVKYPQALQWAIRDFKTNNLDSWIIQYPIAGFTQLLRWYQHELLPLNILHTDIENLKTMKLVHFFATEMMADLFKAPHRSRKWHGPYLSLLYRSFNAPSVPKNMGASNLINTSEFSAQLPSILNSENHADAAAFLGSYTAITDELVFRVQALIYYALYHTRSHVMPKGLFTDLRLRFPLAVNILDPNQSVPPIAIETLLLTPFIPAVLDTANVALDLHNNSITPFVSPFGPSVLKCGVPGCQTPFYPSDADLTAPNADRIVREGRKRHLAEIYGLPLSNDRTKSEIEAKSFEQTTQTGLPDATAPPKPPTSAHYCLHISIARVWARKDVQGRMALFGTPDGKDKFVDEVIRYICTENRRGDVYTQNMEQDIRGVLPSFGAAIAEAVKREGKGGKGNKALAEWEFRFEENTVGKKLLWELELEGRKDEVKRSGQGEDIEMEFGE